MGSENAIAFVVGNIFLDEIKTAGIDAIAAVLTGSVAGHISRKPHRDPVTCVVAGLILRLTKRSVTAHRARYSRKPSSSPAWGGGRKDAPAQTCPHARRRAEAHCCRAAD